MNEHVMQPPLPFPQISVVRVKQLLKPTRDYDWFSDDYGREPRVGDEGTILDVYGTPEKPVYHVECIVREGEHAGSAIWLAFFEHDELELVQAHEERTRVRK